MAIDLSKIEKDVEEVLDSVLNVIPGNPSILATVERPVLHAVLVAVFGLINRKLGEANSISGPTPADTQTKTAMIR